MSYPKIELTEQQTEDLLLNTGEEAIDSLQRQARKMLFDKNKEMADAIWRLYPLCTTSKPHIESSDLDFMLEQYLDLIAESDIGKVFMKKHVVFSEATYKLDLSYLGRRFIGDGRYRRLVKDYYDKFDVDGGLQSSERNMTLSVKGDLTRGRLGPPYLSETIYVPTFDKTVSYTTCDVAHRLPEKDVVNLFHYMLVVLDLEEHWVDPRDRGLLDLMAQCASTKSNLVKKTYPDARKYRLTSSAPQKSNHPTLKNLSFFTAALDLDEDTDTLEEEFFLRTAPMASFPKHSLEIKANRVDSLWSDDAIWVRLCPENNNESIDRPLRFSELLRLEEALRDWLKFLKSGECHVYQAEGAHFVITSKDDETLQLDLYDNR